MFMTMYDCRLFHCVFGVWFWWWCYNIWGM